MTAIKKKTDALAAACGREIRTRPADNLADAIEAATAIADRYGQLLDGALEEVEGSSKRVAGQHDYRAERKGVPGRKSAGLKMKPPQTDSSGGGRQRRLGANDGKKRQFNAE